MDLTDLTAYLELIQDIMGGAVRRHTFTRIELDLLLDVQGCPMRKTAKTEMLRRYLRAVQQRFAIDGSAPQGFATFLEAENQTHHPNSQAQPAALQVRTAVPA